MAKHEARIVTSETLWRQMGRKNAINLEWSPSLACQFLQVAKIDFEQK